MTSTSRPPAQSPGPGKHQILVIDDAADSRLLLSTVLARAGYEPLLAEDGESGLAMLAGASPRLIVVDYSMPDMSGAEVVRRIRARPRSTETPIIMLTSSSEEVHIEEAFAAGANDYLIKPIDRRIIVARIEAMIRAASDRDHAETASHVEASLGQMLSELEGASLVQRDQIARLPVVYRDLVIHGAVVPCSHVGGDLLQVVDGSDEARIAVILDVSGHGTAAALVAASALAELKFLVRSRPLPAALAALNTTLYTNQSGHYACIAAIALQGEHATIINAGLPPICVIRDREIVELIEASGVPPGLVAGACYEQTTLTLRPGDRLVSVSDGLTEPLGMPDDLGPCLDGLGLRAGGAPDSARLPAAIAAVLRGCTQQDDATILIIDREVARDR